MDTSVASGDKYEAQTDFLSLGPATGASSLSIKLIQEMDFRINALQTFSMQQSS